MSRGWGLRAWLGERGGGTTAVVWSRDSGHMKAWSSGCMMTWIDSLPLEQHAQPYGQTVEGCGQPCTASALKLAPSCSLGCGGVAAPGRGSPC